MVFLPYYRMLFFLFSITTLGASSLKTAEKSLVVAHRGGAKEAVENSLEAFSHAIKCGADWLELDVQISKDYVPIVVHDPTTKRFWKGPVRKFSDLTLAQIQRLETNNNLALTIPTLEEVLALSAGRIGVMVEIKGDGTSNYKRFVEEVLHCISYYEKQLAGNYALSSFEPAILEEIRRQSPNTPICLVVDEEACLSYVKSLQPKMISMHMDLLSKNFIQKKQNQGIQIWTWTVNRKERIKECIDMGVDAVVTDWPKLMRSMLPKKPLANLE